MNASKKNLLTVSALAGMLLVVVVIAVYRHGGGDVLSLNQRTAKQSGGSGAGIEVDPEYVIVGGVRRKTSDVKASRPRASTQETQQIGLDVGTTQPVKVDANINVASVAESLRTDQHPERLSPFVQPAPFDRDVFENDPQAYLATIEPGRVFQTAQPGPGVEVLRQLSARHITINQGESVKLQVKTVAGAPVTYKSFDLGRFQNELPTITVQANEAGVAEVEFFGSPGTYNNVNILAGSPMTTGQAKFIVHVKVRAQRVAAPN